ncbi:hypothetical protein C8J56DRAFT_1051288 [Mycena floridula]|nr:hypothetical protein C8J56DRAFT_1051288 [Mycena floridula]
MPSFLPPLDALVQYIAVLTFIYYQRSFENIRSDVKLLSILFPRGEYNLCNFFVLSRLTTLAFLASFLILLTFPAQFFDCQKLFFVVGSLGTASTSTSTAFPTYRVFCLFHSRRIRWISVFLWIASLVLDVVSVTTAITVRRDGSSLYCMSHVVKPWAGGCAIALLLLDTSLFIGTAYYFHRHNECLAEGNILSRLKKFFVGEGLLAVAEKEFQDARNSYR